MAEGWLQSPGINTTSRTLPFQRMGQVANIGESGEDCMSPHLPH